MMKIMSKELNEINSGVKLKSTRKNGKYINRHAMHKRLEKRIDLECKRMLQEISRLKEKISLAV